MISKNQIKNITSLQQKKYRDKTGLFVAEGPKVISEFLKNNYKLEAFYTIEDVDEAIGDSTKISENELKKISFLKTPNTSLAVFEKKKMASEKIKGLTVSLDAIRDPGNLGTIIRLCDWFGVDNLLCSYDTVDCYNPKVVQATMGSLARISVHYVDLEEFLQQTELPVFGGFMDGENVYSKTLQKNAIVVMGNEANGISKEIEAQINQRIAIPQFGKQKDTESLNVATATAILLSEFRRSTEK